MESLSPESKTLYELLKAGTRKEYELRFLEHKKEVMDDVRDFVDDTGKQFKEVIANITAVHADMGAELEEVKSSIGSELHAAKGKLSVKIATLAASVDRALQVMPGASDAHRFGQPGGDAADPFGRRSATTDSGKACESTPPPEGGLHNVTDREILRAGADTILHQVVRPRETGSSSTVPRLDARRPDDEDKID